LAATVIVAGLLIASPAQAGQVSGQLQVTQIAGSSVAFSVTAARTCAPAEYCGYFAVIDELEGDVACPSARGGSDARVWWVGDVQDTGPSTESATQQPYSWSATATGAVRLCLYVYANSIYHVLGGVTVVPGGTPPAAASGQAVVPGPATPATPSVPSAPTPAVPAPTPPSAPEASCDDYEYRQDAQDALDGDPSLQKALDANGDGVACGQLPRRISRVATLGKAEAARFAAVALRRSYGGRFTSRTGWAISCGRLSRVRVRCAVRWRHAGTWRGTVTVVGVIRDNKQSVIWHVKVRHRKPPRAPSAPAPSSGGGGCDPSYPTVCIPPAPPDLDCPEVPYTDFTVVGADPHGFDGDGDGVGCES
jgi:hypothetical protein